METGLTVKKNENFSEWYRQLVVKGQLIDYGSDVNGCYILKPNAMKIWDTIRKEMQQRLDDMGVDNVYFPLLIPQKNLFAEKEHFEDFCPEVAWVTHTGSLSDASAKLDEPYAIRPTSETGMYPIFAKWIHSHRDLPLKVNQWNNVLRWEFKQATPFIRSREFLWQEGHTAHETKASAMQEVDETLDMYAEIYRDLLAIPVIKGTKTKKEKFAGATLTKTCETFVLGSGKAIQAATSHYLGQHFSKMFEILFETKDESAERQHVHQNSWGFTTRSIGICAMVHSDDKGLVLPPKIAPLQIVIIPIYKKNVPHEHIDEYAHEILRTCKANGFKTMYDDSQGHNVGYKYNKYELLGVPIRIEVGPRDLKNRKCVVVRRDIKEKTPIDFDKISDTLDSTMKNIQVSLLERAKENMYGHIKISTNYDDMIAHIKANNLALVPACGDPICEDTLKEFSKERHECNMKSLCVPDDLTPFKVAPDSDSDDKASVNSVNSVSSVNCVNKLCDKKGKWTLFGKSY